MDSIKNEIKGIDIISENEHLKNVKVGRKIGINLYYGVLKMVLGIENLALIPGNIRLLL